MSIISVLIVCNLNFVYEPSDTLKTGKKNAYNFRTIFNLHLIYSIQIMDN